MTPTDKEAIENHLIENGRKVLEIHYNHDNRLDQKAQRFLAFMGAIEGYFILNFFLNHKFNSLDRVGITMLIALILGIIIIGIYINILQSKPFYNGPDIAKQTDAFRPNGSMEETRKDTLATLKISYEENIKTINRKSKLFKISVRGIGLYAITLGFYFIALKMTPADLPNDIAGNDDILITENVGAIEESQQDIQIVEQKYAQEELSAPTETTPHHESTTENPSLTSDHLGVSEDTDITPPL